MDWSAVWDDKRCPVVSIPLEHTDGWFYLRPGKTEGEKGELVLPLTKVVRKHLDALPRPKSPANGTRRLVLPSPVCNTSLESRFFCLKPAQKTISFLPVSVDGSADK